jgi:hypothetical protein
MRQLATALVSILIVSIAAPASGQFVEHATGHSYRPGRPLAEPKEPEPEVPEEAAEAPEEAAEDDGPKIDIYGLVKLDGAYDTSRINPGNFARWVELVENGVDDDEFNMTANQSRIGLAITEISKKGPETEARFEIDFYGGGAENKSRPMLRHAYFALAWENDLELLAGQTSDLFSPLVPYTLNYSVAWWAGNIGYRRPQVRLSKGFQVGKQTRLELAGALARTIGDQVSDFSGIDSGADAGLPSFQARIGLGFAGGAGTLGLSGHWAEEEFDISAEGDSENFDSWSLNLDGRKRFGERVSVQGEIFRGCNLAAYLGGIGQGVNLEAKEELFSQGGWLSLDYKASPRLDLHFGGSLEDVDEEFLEAGDRSKNSSIFGNGVYSMTRSAGVGLEFSYWQTDYFEIRRENSLRTQFSFIYRFSTAG